MDRSNTPTLLIPLLALLAIAFPFAVNLRPPAAPGGNTHPPSQVSLQRSNKEPETRLQPHSAAKLIEDFLHAPADQGRWQDGDPRANYTLNFMIAIVADPIDSRLTRTFDSSISSIQRAFEASGYVLDRFDLAWSEPAGSKAGASPDNDGASKDKPETADSRSQHSQLSQSAENPRYRRQPSLLLFRDPPDPSRNRAKGKLSMVFLVGETPTSGLRKAAMRGALDQLADFWGWVPGSNKLPDELYKLAQNNRSRTVKIMGPTFSGSAVSLEFALRDWLAQLPGRVRTRVKFRIVSGTATAIHPEEFYTIGAGGLKTFRAVVPPDDAVMPKIFNYISSLGYGLGYKRIVMLTEGSTAYGQVSTRGYKPSRVLNLPFPLHISQLRTASEKQRQSLQNSASGVINNPAPSVPLNTGEASQPKETPPSFSSLEAPSSDLVLSRLLSTISHEGYHAVGILNTDVRDTIFLARQIHQHCPGTFVFTVNSDLLYSHPDVGVAARGMLVFTPYPLFNPNQVWTPPFLGGNSRLQFSSQDAECVYNATLALLCRKDLILDYGEPFQPQGSEGTAKPALWVTVVGRNGPLPVTVLQWEGNKDEHYSLIVDRHDQEQLTIDQKGIYTSGSVLGIVLLSGVLIGFSLLVIRRYHSPRNQEEERQSGLYSSLLGGAATPEYRRQACLFLLVSMISLLSFYLVVISAYSLPAIASWSLGTLPPTTDWHWLVPLVLVLALIVTALLSLAGATVVLLRNSRKAPHQKSSFQGMVKGVVLLGCLYALLLSLRLAVVWIYTAWEGHPEAFFTYIRAFEFSSGISPLVPISCLALAGFLWGFYSSRRLQIIDGVRLKTPERSGKKNRLHADTESFKGVTALVVKVRKRLERPSALARGQYAFFIFLGELVVMCLFFFPFVPSYEGREFYFLCAWGIFLIYLALSMEFVRLYLTWATFRHLLQRLAVHPMRKAYGRYRESFKGLNRIDLAMPLQTFAVLSFSVDQAERMHRMASNLSSSQALPAGEKLNLESWMSDARQKVPLAARSLSEALGADAQGKSRLAIVKRSESQQALGILAQATAKLLEPSWHKAANLPSITQESRQLKAFRELAEEFLAGRTVLLISYVVPSLRNLGALILSGLLLVLFAEMFYPFVQKNHLLAVNWIVILAFAGLALMVVLQMERDAVLSALNGTTPGKVKVTRQFAFRVLTYVMVPILVLLSVQFPDTIGQIVSWFSATQGH